MSFSGKYKNSVVVNYAERRKIVSQSSFKKYKFDLELTNLEQGIYVFRAEFDKEIKFTKIIKSN